MHSQMALESLKKLMLMNNFSMTNEKVEAAGHTWYIPHYSTLEEALFCALVNITAKEEARYLVENRARIVLE